jgi:putative addiction module killer protein
MGMKTILKTDVFNRWLEKLRDAKGKALILKSIYRLSDENFSDIKPIDHHLFEMRIHFGAGYRVYFYSFKKKIIVLLCGGGKSTQKQDIQKAKKLLKGLNYENH